MRSNGRVLKPVVRSPGTSPRYDVKRLASSKRVTSSIADTKLSAVTGQDIERIHIVGGGSQNELLCQMTANASKREVVAGPVEATAIGNISIQAITSGELGDLSEARELIARSFPMKTYEPKGFFWREARERFAELGVRRFDFNIDYERGVGAVDFGTYIAPRVYASYGIGLFDNENVIRVRYDLQGGFGITLTSGQKESGFDLSYQFER